MDYFNTIAVVLFLYMTLWFIVSLIKKRNDVADIAWGLGFILVAWTSFYLSEENDLRSLIVNVLVTIWGIRLAVHVYMRNKNKAEDYRYNAWRKMWGKYFYLRSYFQVFILQGILLYIIALPILLANLQYDTSVDALVFVGILIWIVGFFFETVGDMQLVKFVKNSENKGKLMQEGLWKYTRHPNYFGEVVQWWGIWIIVFLTPYGLWGIISPLTITILIMKISGIPMLEKKMSKHPDFAEYKKRVSVFFPLPQKGNKKQVS